MKYALSLVLLAVIGLCFLGSLQAQMGPANMEPMNNAMGNAMGNAMEPMMDTNAMKY